VQPPTITATLWAHGFDEVATALFTATLRQAGQRCKLVGLSRRPAPGAHGLVIVPDWSLDQALSMAPATRCILIPGAEGPVRAACTDPRVRTFLQRAYAQGAHCISSPGGLATLAELALTPSNPARMQSYPAAVDELHRFALELARWFGEH
jgi:putative intracellular protease/amidase